MKRVAMMTGLVVLGAAGPLLADPAADTASAVTKADRAFAALAAKEGTAAAFRDTVDPEQGLVFTGTGKATSGAANIFKVMGAENPSQFLLTWVPVKAWGSRGGDMGVTTGDWAQVRKGTSTPLVTGTYVTVWHLDQAGHWKGLIDIGEPDPKPLQNAATPSK